MSLLMVTLMVTLLFFFIWCDHEITVRTLTVSSFPLRNQSVEHKVLFLKCSTDDRRHSSRDQEILACGSSRERKLQTVISFFFYNRQDSPSPWPFLFLFMLAKENVRVPVVALKKKEIESCGHTKVSFIGRHVEEINSLRSAQRPLIRSQEL